MTIANWCILTACLLPIISVNLARLRPSTEAGQQFDNHAPRFWQSQLTGWQQRAVAAQSNGFEALPLFIAGVLIAQMNHANQTTVNAIALSFIAVRCLYLIFYLCDLASLRSFAWLLGMALSISLFCLV